MNCGEKTIRGSSGTAKHECCEKERRILFRKMNELCNVANFSSDVGERVTNLVIEPCTLRAEEQAVHMEHFVLWP